MEVVGLVVDDVTEAVDVVVVTVVVGFVVGVVVTFVVPHDASSNKIAIVQLAMSNVSFAFIFSLFSTIIFRCYIQSRKLSKTGYLV